MPARRREIYTRLIGPKKVARNDLRRKLSTTVYLTEKQVEQLEDLRTATQVPIAVRIRDGIDAILDQEVERGTFDDEE